MQQRIIYNLLICPHYRIWRHIILIIAIILIVFNQLFYIYDFRIVFVKQLVIYIIPVTISYIFVIYFNLYVLTPKYLLSKKYLRFAAGLIFSVFVLNAIVTIAEYAVYKVTNTPYNDLSVFHENNFIADMVFYVFQLSICVMGVSAITLLKEWMKENKNILRLEKEILKSEVEQLKERIAPEILFRILNSAGRKANEDTEDASVILVKLSRALRYQLYDYSRDKVLLKSEISFIENYLLLLQISFGKPDYKINIEGNMNMIFIPPLLFFSLLQVIIDNTKRNAILNIDFIIDKKQILFRSTADSFKFADFAKLEQRLKFLYGNEYRMKLIDNQVDLEIRI